jgi:hypothetical protein
MWLIRIYSIEHALKLRLTIDALHDLKRKAGRVLVLKPGLETKKKGETCARPVDNRLNKVSEWWVSEYLRIKMVVCLRQCLANARRWDGTGCGEGWANIWG